MMLKIGTYSWKYDSWKGIVYSDKEKINFLSEYSKHFDNVEIDQCFWSLFESKKAVLPIETDVKSYPQSVTDDFRLTITIPNRITLTHFYDKSKTEDLKPNPLF